MDGQHVIQSARPTGDYFAYYNNTLATPVWCKDADQAARFPDEDSAYEYIGRYLTAHAVRVEPYAPTPSTAEDVLDTIPLTAAGFRPGFHKNEPAWILSYNPADRLPPRYLVVRSHGDGVSLAFYLTPTDIGRDAPAGNAVLTFASSLEAISFLRAFRIIGGKF